MDYKYIVLSTLDLEKSKYLEQLVNQSSKALSYEFNSVELVFKYKDNHLGYSLHSLLILDDNVVAAFTCMPRKIDNLSVLVGCDTFVDKDHRKNIFILKNLFNSLQKSELCNNYSLILGVPNEKASLYWDKIAKWEIKGELDIVVLPVIHVLLRYLFALIYFIIIMLFFAKRKNKLSQNISDIKKFRNYTSINNVYVRNYVEHNKNVSYVFGFSKNTRLELAYNVFNTIVKNGNSVVLVGFNTQVKMLKMNYFIKRKLHVHVKCLDEITLEDVVFDLGILDNR